jgi:hypothetical protein
MGGIFPGGLRPADLSGIPAGGIALLKIGHLKTSSRLRVSL